ncbi:hypothetical protein EVJ50_03310 [Synechococcus sp. RSCCF101]|nr:hypothetical protein EVJ50_03310 [Synechococcus sp. RSCCF101]
MLCALQRRLPTGLALRGMGVATGVAMLAGMGSTGEAERLGERLSNTARLERMLLAAPNPEPEPQPLSRAALVDNGDAADGVYRITPERRALLNTIRYAEGTWLEGSDRGYRILYGGGEFQDLARHPERVVVRRYSSAAAGAYQFLPATWSAAAQKLSLRSFEPQAQDQAALYLVEKRGALAELDRDGLTDGVMARLAPEWASFPTRAGVSAYGQPVKGHRELAAFYDSNLQELRRNRLAALASQESPLPSSRRRIRRS